MIYNFKDHSGSMPQSQTGIHMSRYISCDFMLSRLTNGLIALIFDINDTSVVVLFVLCLGV